ncbi:hypothetical protein [Commensalibacter nepenthis]|uniref:Protein NO VEIN C-terminal domain-containing protein n=1 Tax=Commensalibacter nepenthis TaxID=3043872 RepID=A0ABT6Q9X4_9PROT|nr:hypothetical protein [Commensalibacter sp. TBRC 10068]MDI2113115.1 hypothetical protein [Commensalibacter sp. TBRC 10068]
MSKIIRPVLFSSYFNISTDILFDNGLIDPFINCDTPLFIDPFLLEKSQNSLIKNQAVNRLKNQFQNIIKFLIQSKKENDAAWKAALRLLNLHEAQVTSLGYGHSGRFGSSRSGNIKITILRVCREIIEVGFEDPELICMMNFFEDGIGVDTISDLTTNIIFDDLAEITKDFCQKYNIPLEKRELFGLNNRFVNCNVNAASQNKCYDLPVLKNGYPIVLVPKDIVKVLQSDIDGVISQNYYIRDAINRYWGNVTKLTIANKKAAIKRSTFEDVHNFETLLKSLKNFARAYNPSEDEYCFYKIKEIFQYDPIVFKNNKTYQINNISDVMSVVKDTIHFFKDHIENKNLWEALWNGDQPKMERASQILYYAMADSFCRANNIDISPEADMGRGPVDFKFSQGFDAKVLVEMKLSTGNVVHGYKKQLEHYKKAAQTEAAFYVIMDYGNNNFDKKLQEIYKIKNDLITQDQRASDIIVIDACKKKSASKI